MSSSMIYSQCKRTNGDCTIFKLDTFIANFSILRGTARLSQRAHSCSICQCNASLSVFVYFNTLYCQLVSLLRILGLPNGNLCPRSAGVFDGTSAELACLLSVPRRGILYSDRQYKTRLNASPCSYRTLH